MLGLNVNCREKDGDEMDTFSLLLSADAGTEEASSPNDDMLLFSPLLDRFSCKKLEPPSLKLVA